MPRGDAPPDASTLGVSALNVGMPEEHSFGKRQSSKVAQLADIIERWLGDTQGPAVVGLNEIAPGIANNLVRELVEARVLNVGSAAHETNCLLWRAPDTTSLSLRLLSY